MSVIFLFFFLMIRRPPRSTRIDTLFPYTTLFRSQVAHPVVQFAHQQIGVFLAALLFGDVDADSGQPRIVEPHVPVAARGDPAHPALGVLEAVLDRIRSEERRVGKECVSTCRSRWSTIH